MTSKLTKLFAAAVVVGGLATATTVFAEGAASPSQPPPTQNPMGGHSGMMNMQMNPDQMKQMTRMVDNCNRMMESMGNAPPVTPEPAPPTHG